MFVLSPKTGFGTKTRLWPASSVFTVQRAFTRALCSKCTGMYLRPYPVSPDVLART